MTQALPRIPACPSPLSDETLSSWTERTACFYGSDLDHWVGQFSTELLNAGRENIDLDSSAELRMLLSKWSCISQSKLPQRLTDAENWLPKTARLAFCEHCWDEDVQNGHQPYIRRRWVRWASVVCETHGAFLCAKNPHIDNGAPFISWQDVWRCKPSWRIPLGLPEKAGFASNIWYRPGIFVSPGYARHDLIRVFSRFSDPSDTQALNALAHVQQIWTYSGSEPNKPRLPVLLENRIEVLSQAVSALGQDHL